MKNTFENLCIERSPYQGITDAGYAKLAKKYVNYYLEREGSRFCFMELDHQRTENIVDLISALKLTPRQIQEVFRTLGHLFETSERNRGQLYWCLEVGSIAMAAFKTGAPSIFNALGNQKLEAAEAKDFIEQTIKDSQPEWWFTLFYTGEGLRTEEEESLEAVMARAGFIDESGTKPESRDLSRWWSGWGRHNSGRFKQIYDKIQQISQWD